MGQHAVPPPTERLRFRRLDERDVADLVALDSDPEVTKYVTSTAPPDAADFRDAILPRWNATFADSPFGFFAALDRTGEDAFVGWFHLRPDGPDPNVLDLGFRLRRSVWGRGLATEGGRALIAWGFSFEHVERITGHCLEGNAASARVLRKCGLHFVGSFVVPPERLPGWHAARRRGMGFALAREGFLKSCGESGRRE